MSMPPHDRQPYRFKRQHKAERKYWERQQHENHIHIVSALDRLRNHIRAYTKKQRADDGKKTLREWLTIIGLFVAAIVAYSTMRVAHIDAKRTIRDTRAATDRTIDAMNEQLRTMQGQLAEMKVEQRPWIKISNPIVMSNPLTADVESGNFILSANITIENVGVIPAVNVSSFYYEYIPMNFDEFMNIIVDPNIAQKSCSTARQPDSDSAKFRGNTLFPKDPISIEVATTSKLSDDIAVHPGYINIGSVKDHVFVGGVITFHVTYQASHDATVHCTAQTYYLGVKNRDVRATRRILIKGKWLGDIDKRNFGFKPAGIAGGYAD